MKGITIQFERKESDFLKVIAALLVVTAHYCGYLLHFEQFADIAIIKALSAQCGKIGVGIFFLLSGYGLMESQRRSPLSFVDFLKKRISKIYIPALVVSVIFEIMRACLGSIHIDNPVVILKDVFLIGNDSVLWFVRVLLVLYIIFDIYVHLNFRLYRLLVVLISTGVMCCLLVPHQFASIPLFYLGVYISNNKDANKLVLPVLFSLIGVFITMFLVGGGHIYAYVSISYIVITVFLILRNITRKRLYDFLGLSNYSFDLYLVHHKVISICLLTGFYASPILYIVITSATTFVFYLIRKSIDNLILNKQKNAI